MAIIDRRQAQEISREWRKKYPEDAKRLDEIMGDKDKLMDFLRSKGFHFDSKDARAFWRAYLQTEEIIYWGKHLSAGSDHLIVKHQQFWKGYLHCLKDLGVELLGMSKSSFEEDLTFDFKMRVVRGLKETYPDGEIGFVCGAVHYTLAEVEALEALRNLF